MSGSGISWVICKSAPRRSFLQAVCPSYRPTNSIRALGLAKIWNFKFNGWHGFYYQCTHVLMEAGSHLTKWKSTLSLQLTDFDKIWHDDASGTSALCWPLKFPEFENPKWRLAAILKTRKIAISPHLFDRCWRKLTQWFTWHSGHHWPIKFQDFKNSS